MDALVIGAGVSGLTTAICLAEAGYPVRVWAAEPPQRTTSAVAGALWGPSFQEPLDATLTWTQTSLEAFQQLAADATTGVRLATVTSVGDLPAGDELPPQVTSIPGLRPCAADEVPAGYRTGFRGTMPVVDMPTYLDYLQSRLAAAGTEIEIRHVTDLTQATGASPVVVNCAGLGARDLVGDRTVRPVRGQHVVLTNPGIDDAFIELTAQPEFTSFVVHRERIVCGGNVTQDDWDLTVDTDLTRRILDRCRRVEPRLADAQVIETLVGLRPVRPAVRVEAEQLGGALVVHNYGHGGNGVSLSWGCARQATTLVTTAPTR